MSQAEQFQREFLQQLGGSRLQLSRLFDELPDIYFFAKDLDGRFVLCNSAIIQALGLASKWDMIGKTDYDLIPREIADAYREADRRVIESGKPVRNIVEPVPSAKGLLTWYVTSKIPLLGADGRIAGVAVAMRDIERVGAVLGPYREMTRVIEFIHRNYQEPVTIVALAKTAGCSVRQFERRFKKLFGCAPMAYVSQHRVRVASTALRETNATIATVALDAGFYDHSHFVKFFRRFTSMTPTEYRLSCQSPSQPESTKTRPVRRHGKAQ